ncbi:MAG TPA: transglutaminase domain-containing protein, partial [Chitinophagaceae bacterium]|nr:transglutaminase domain-containing protein [Chitinophagaceae bacterium]
DTIFHGEKDELKRILLLRDWIRKVISINDFADHYPGHGSAEGILDAALKGYGFHCGHFMIVQNAVMNAYGYVTRCLGAGPGVKGGPDGHHGINEIWLNKYHKWFLSDAKYNHHFEKNGIPLSALEVRDEYLKNKAADIVMVKGADRTPIAFDSVADKNGVMQKVTKERFAQTFTWIEWEQLNNRFTSWPDFNTPLNMYQDDYFKNHTWIWDGKPHWAYNTPYMRLVSDRKAIEWTPNTIDSKVVIEGNRARIELDSNTPNFKTYQMKEIPNGNWIDVPKVVEVDLKEDNNEIVFRTVNLGGVTGPEHKVIIRR